MSSVLKIDTEETTNSFESSDDVFDVEHVPSITPANARPSLNTPMSETSKHYDRNGKGFLDDTEKALRKLDSENLGYLTVDKVYAVMDTLQKEQNNSRELLNVLQKQQRQMIGLKKGILGLCVFAVLLAISNIGTSFAAARLAREVEVSSSTGDLENIATGERVGVTSKIVDFEMHPISAERRRQLSTTSVCARARSSNGRGNTSQGNTEFDYDCEVVGTLSNNDMVLFHQQFCNGWAPGKKGCLGGGVEKVRLTCNGHISIFNDEGLDENSPEQDPGYFDFVAYPAIARTYSAVHHVYPAGVDRYPGPPCKQDFVAGMYCNPYDDSEGCLVIAMMPAGTDKCFGRFVELCGPEEEEDTQDSR